jgi:type I restriction enzyme M protein
VGQDVQEMNVLLVHEGAYLIGTPCLLTRFDTRILYQHHLAKLRVLSSSLLSGPLLIAALLSPIVQRQIRSKQFTADVIDSIVGRFPEVVLPLPRDPARRIEVEEQARTIFGPCSDDRCGHTQRVHQLKH